MPDAPHLSAVSSQDRQGVGARLFRCLGGAVRGAITGITRVARRRRPATPPAPNPQAAQSPEPPCPCEPQRTPRGQRVRNRAPFSPETHPHLSPEACALLNTPVNQCDPEMIALLLSVVARHLAESAPPELGLTDPRAVFAILSSRLAGALADAPPGTAPAEQPDQAPEGPEGAAPQPDAPPDPSVPPSETQAATPPDSAGETASATAPAGALLSKPGFYCPHPRPGPGRLRVSRARVPRNRGARGGPRTLPARRLCYAACAGPP